MARGALAAARAPFTKPGGDGRAVLIGHDWGAIAAHGAANFAPERWRRLVTAAIPSLGTISPASLLCIRSRAAATPALSDSMQLGSAD